MPVNFGKLIPWLVKCCEDAEKDLRKPPCSDEVIHLRDGCVKKEKDASYCDEAMKQGMWGVCQKVKRNEHVAYCNTLFPTAEPPTSITGIIIGGSIGGSILLIALLVFIFLMCRKKKTGQNNQNNSKTLTGTTTNPSKPATTGTASGI